MNDNQQSTPTRRFRRIGTGGLRGVLALGSALLLTIGITTAAFTDERQILISGSDDTAKGIGHADQPAIWLTDAGNSGYITPSPVGRDHWMGVHHDVPIGINPDSTFMTAFAIFPQWGATYALDVTPTLASALDPDASEPDPFPWLIFTVKLPDGRTLKNLSAKEFNEHPDRFFSICNTDDGSIGYNSCTPDSMAITVTLDPLTPYTFRNSKANFRISFEAVTNPERPGATS